MKIGYYTGKIYPDDKDPQDIPECTSPIRDNQSVYKIMKNWQKLHAKCEGCLECQEAGKIDPNDYENLLLIIKVEHPLKTEVLQNLHSRILEQKKTGVVILPAGCSAFLAPKDIAVQVENGDDLLGIK